MNQVNLSLLWFIVVEYSFETFDFNDFSAF